MLKFVKTNVPVSEAIEVALRCLYPSDTPPNIESSTFKLLFEVAVTNVYSKSNGNFYCQKGLAIGASLRYIGPNLYKKFRRE